MNIFTQHTVFARSEAAATTLFTNTKLSTSTSICILFCIFYNPQFKSSIKTSFLLGGSHTYQSGIRRACYYVRTLRAIITRKMVPIPRRASSFLVFVFIHVNRKEEEEGETEQQQFTKGCNILHRLQVYHLTLTCIIHNKYSYINTIFINIHAYTYIMIALIIVPLLIELM